MQKRHLFRIFLLLVAVTLLLLNDVSTSLASLGSDNLQQPSYEKLNLLILVKASQSSNRRISDLTYAKSRLEIIQDTIPSVLEQYPFPSNVDLGIMAYGHIIDKSDFNLSCSSDNVELVVQLQPASQNPNLENLLSITGRGEVPIAVALEEAGKVFTQKSSDVLNVILLIADGSDTCIQDPVLIAKDLAVNKSIVIYTVGFMSDTKASAELDEIAKQTSGKYWFISPYTGDNELATAELTKVLTSVFDELLVQIFEPLPTNTVPPTETASLTPVPTDTSKPISTPTNTPTQTIPEKTLPNPLPTDEPPSRPTGTLGVFIVLAVVLGSGLWFFRLRKTTKPVTEVPATEISITDSEKLELFRKDLFKAYFSIEAKKHYPKYIPLEAIKEELSSKYKPEQLDVLLRQARRKYPDKIWIDRDSKDQPVYIKIKR